MPTKKPPADLLFLDTETTGLGPEHEVWEVGCYKRTWHQSNSFWIKSEREYHWYLPVDIGKADPIALAMNGFYNRYPHVTNQGVVDSLTSFSKVFFKLSRTTHIVGAVPSFDTTRIEKILRANNACPNWNYHIINIEDLMVGWLRAQIKYDGLLNDSHREELEQLISLPFKSDELSLACGIDRSKFDKHSALGDAKWAMAVYDKICI